MPVKTNLPLRVEYTIIVALTPRRMQLSNRSVHLNDNCNSFLFDRQTPKGVFTMSTNESGLDRIIRTVAGIALIVLFIANVVSGSLGIIALVVGIVLLLTGLVGFCPLYSLLKIRTNKA
jgi:type IV secretory pathway VirB6-like protein